MHADDPAFGYRFIADELAEAGFTASERRVWRVCSENEIFSAFVRKRRGKGRLVGPPVRDDLVRRELTAADPNRLWLTDIKLSWGTNPSPSSVPSRPTVLSIWSGAESALPGQAAAPRIE